MMRPVMCRFSACANDLFCADENPTSPTYLSYFSLPDVSCVVGSVNHCKTFAQLYNNSKNFCEARAPRGNLGVRAGRAAR